MCSTVVLFACGAFAQNQGWQDRKQKMEGQVHGGSPSTGITLPEVIKRKKLQNYPSATIGDAFSKYKYFSKVEWQEYQASSGKIYINCTGHLKKKGFWNMVHHPQAVEVKFVVYPTGEYGVLMVSRIDYNNDGKNEKYPLADMNGVLKRIYSNQEISF